MEKRDARKLSSEEQYDLRKKVIRLSRQGNSFREIAEILGTSHTYVSNIWNIYLDGGGRIAVLRPKVRGRKNGEQRRLTPDQEMIIFERLVEGKPNDPKKGPWLWSHVNIQTAIEQEVGINLPLRTISDYLKRWGLAPTNPIYRVKEQRLKKICRWLEEEYPKILVQSKVERAGIHWCDIVRLEKDIYREEDSSENCVMMISIITNCGKVKFMVSNEGISEHVYKLFLDRLTKESKRKVLLVSYKFRAYRSRTLNDWLDKNKDKIEVFFLPSHLPELAVTLTEL